MGTLHLVVNVLSLILGLRSRTGNLLGWSFTILLLWTLTPHEYVIYCQAWGLSGHTSPCGECALSHFRATLEDWLPARLVFCYFSTLDPDTIWLRHLLSGSGTKWAHFVTPRVLALHNLTCITWAWSSRIHKPAFTIGTLNWNICNVACYCMFLCTYANDHECKHVLGRFESPKYFGNA